MKKIFLEYLNELIYMLKEYENHRPKNMLFQPIAAVTSALSGFFNFLVKNFEPVVVQRLI